MMKPGRLLVDILSNWTHFNFFPVSHSVEHRRLSQPPHCVRIQCVYLFEGVQHFLSLAEVPEEQLQGSRHQGGVVVHGEVRQHPQEHTAAFVVHLQDAVPLPACTQRVDTHTCTCLHVYILCEQHHVPDSKHGLGLLADVLQVDGG